MIYNWDFSILIAYSVVGPGVVFWFTAHELGPIWQSLWWSGVEGLRAGSLEDLCFIPDCRPPAWMLRRRRKSQVSTQVNQIWFYYFGEKNIIFFQANCAKLTFIDQFKMQLCCFHHRGSMQIAAMTNLIFLSNLISRFFFFFRSNFLMFRIWDFAIFQLY